MRSIMHLSCLLHAINLAQVFVFMSTTFDTKRRKSQKEGKRKENEEYKNKVGTLSSFTYLKNFFQKDTRVAQKVLPVYI